MTFEITVRVEPDDIDALGHVNNIVYLRWVQDIAVAHWRAAAAPEHQAAVMWVVLRHEIDYKYPARSGDEILVRTRVGAGEGIRFERHTDILRSPDQKLLAQARTVWCPIDPKTGRPCKVPAGIRSLFSAGGGDCRPVA
jgi:acyl-CoA thioester hydrolase